MGPATFVAVKATLGINIPFVVLLTSSMALASGIDTSPLIPTLCAFVLEESKKIRIKKRMHSFFINENLKVEKLMSTAFFIV